MCGIYGVIGQGIVKADIDVFYQLGVANILRGSDASGIAFGNTRVNSTLYSTKSVGDFLSLYYTYTGDKIKRERFDSIMNTIFLGHNRHTTVGSYLPKAAHPYAFENFIGMHNGTIHSPHVRDLVSNNDGKDGGYLTDSQALLSLIQRDGLDKTLCSLNDDKDAYALSIWDTKDKKLTLVRNSRRPLMFAVHMSRPVMYYSSEEEALDFVLQRSNIKYKKYEPQERTTFQIDPVKINSNGNRSWESYDLGATTYKEPVTISTPVYHKENNDKNGTKYFIYEGKVKKEVSKEEWERSSLTI